jgi:cytidylate kinase
MVCRVITIDGPAASGKGSVAKQLARDLGYHYLESGLIYRAVAILILQNFVDRKINLEKIQLLTEQIKNSSPEALLPEIKDIRLKSVVSIIKTTKFSFIGNQIMIDQQDISDLIHNETIGLIASYYSRIPEIRKELVDVQRSFAVSPGLVTDGRDMGSMIFPDADLKVFLTADIEVRAKRAYNRYCSLHNIENENKLNDILQQLKIRDAQDTNRQYAKLQYDASYLLIDNTNINIPDTLKLIKDKFLSL